MAGPIGPRPPATTAFNPLTPQTQEEAETLLNPDAPKSEANTTTLEYSTDWNISSLPPGYGVDIQFVASETPVASPAPAPPAEEAEPVVSPAPAPPPADNIADPFKPKKPKDLPETYDKPPLKGFKDHIIIKGVPILGVPQTLPDGLKAKPGHSILIATDKDGNTIWIQFPSDGDPTREPGSEGGPTTIITQPKDGSPTQTYPKK